MICQDSRAPNVSIELEIFWGGGGGAGNGRGVQTLSIEISSSMEKFGALEPWQIIVSLPILLDRLAYLPIGTLIQEFIEFICVNIDFIR